MCMQIWTSSYALCSFAGVRSIRYFTWTLVFPSETSEVRLNAPSPARSFGRHTSLGLQESFIYTSGADDRLPTSITLNTL